MRNCKYVKQTKRFILVSTCLTLSAWLTLTGILPGTVALAAPKVAAAGSRGSSPALSMSSTRSGTRSGESNMISGSTGATTGPTGTDTGSTGAGKCTTGPGTGSTGAGMGTTGMRTGTTGTGNGSTGTGTGTTGTGSGSSGTGTGTTGTGSESTGTGTGTTGAGSGSTGSGQRSHGNSITLSGPDAGSPTAGSASVGRVTGIAMASTASSPAFDASNPPPVDNLPQGVMVGRQPGALFAGTGHASGQTVDGMTYLATAGTTVSIQVDSRPPGPNYAIQIYYWKPALAASPFHGRWIALSSTLRDGRAVAVNDGHYTGWFAAWWVVEPQFTDIAGVWAANRIERLDGLGLVEGYPGLYGDERRPFAPGQAVTRAEFAAMVGRVELIPPQQGYPVKRAISAKQADSVLQNYFADQATIPNWARSLVAAMAQAGYVRGMDGNFNPDQPVTRIQADVIVSRVLKAAGKKTPADPERISDAAAVPGWAHGAQGIRVLLGIDGQLHPNDSLTRAQASAMLLRLVRDLGF